ncbi:hypothetical protein [Mammaliicoccus sciuri]|uniref:hypothetical protein n=1 Tax=Mammaliicoccus sciuri TaxID=1296 RepID=UPI003A9044B4
MNKIIIGLIILVILALTTSIFVTVKQYNHKQTFEGKITEKYNKRSGDIDKFYIVLDNEKVIENTDLLFRRKFNSADVQAKLKIGDKVEVKTIGYRVHLLNMYPIMYEVKEENK